MPIMRKLEPHELDPDPIAALRGLMLAYERLVRSGMTAEHITAVEAEPNKAPWRCAEYVAAERALQGGE